MAKSLATLLIGLGLVAATTCGRKGPLELPPGRAPMPVETMTAVPGPGGVILRWTNPAKAVSGRPVGPLDAVEIWVFDRGLPAGDRPLTSDEVEKTARLVRRIPRREFGTYAEKTGDGSSAMAFSFDAGPQAPVPAKLAFTVRVFDRHGRASAFSAPVTVDVARKGAAAAGDPR
jgi:predicted small lipoprotein YifL